MRIRRLGPGDRHALTLLLAESFAEELDLSGLGPESVRDQVTGVLFATMPPARWGLRLLGVAAEVWVGTLGREIVGCYGLFGRSPMTISTVAVHPSHRGRGLGRTLMEHAMVRLRALGATQAVLEVLAGNEPAVRLYRSLGFAPYDRRRSYTLRTPPRGRVAVRPEELRFAPTGGRSMEVFRQALAASVPPEALRFEAGYRSEYLPRLGTGWLEGAGAARRTVLLGDRPVAFACVRRPDRQPLAEIPPPLYLPEAKPYLRPILDALTGIAADTRAASIRLRLSEDRPEGWAAAESLGYRFERSWLYMRREI